MIIVGFGNNTISNSHAVGEAEICVKTIVQTSIHELLICCPDFVRDPTTYGVHGPTGTPTTALTHLPKRRMIMQTDYLDKLKAGAEIVSINEGT